MTLTVSIPKSCWMTANRHTVNRGHRKAMVDAIHQRVQFEAKRARLAPIRGRVACEWFIAYPKGVRLDKGDPTNAQPTTKAFLDALVPRWLEDDGPAVVAWERFRRGPNLDRPGDHEVTLVLVPQVIPFDLEKTA